MKEAGADPATLQPTMAQGGPIRRQPPDPGWPPRVGLSSRNRPKLAGLAITRVEKRSALRQRWETGVQFAGAGSNEIRSRRPVAAASRSSVRVHGFTLPLSRRA